MRPSNAESVTSKQIKTLLTLCHVAQRDGRATIRTVASGRCRGIANTHDELCALRSGEFVAWEDGKDGTLRSTVAVVSVA